MKILCTADVHIGRRSSRLPAGTDSRAVSAGACWGRIVEVAVRERVDLVAVAGDLVDRANRFYEAAGPVEAGLRQLADARIPVALVAGNHDHEVLPWLLDRPLGGRVHLLGRNGTWERLTLESRGERLYVDGWSFPAATVRTSPLAEYPFTDDGTPVLGLLHADLDQPRSVYAPVSRAELQARPAALWLLGHVHAPRLLAAADAGAVLYPGSPQALDPGEPGLHGVWIAELDAASPPRLRRVPVSTVQYQRVEVDAEGVAGEPELNRRVLESVARALDAAVAGSHGLRFLVCRVRLTGRTVLHRELEPLLRRTVRELDLARGEARACVDGVEVETRPPHALEELARTADAPGLLARLILALRDGSAEGEYAALLRDVRQRGHDAARATAYLSLDDGIGLDDARVRAELGRQATLLLDLLLSQTEDAA